MEHRAVKTTSCVSSVFLGKRTLIAVPSWHAYRGSLMMRVAFALTAVAALGALPTSAKASVETLTGYFSGLYSGLAIQDDRNQPNLIRADFAFDRPFSGMYQTDVFSLAYLPGGGVVARDYSITTYFESVTKLSLFFSEAAQWSGSYPTYYTFRGWRIGSLTSGDVAYRAVISRLEVVPEPARWAMMIGGLSLAGVAVRRRTRSQVTAPTRSAVTRLP